MNTTQQTSLYTDIEFLIKELKSTYPVDMRHNFVDEIIDIGIMESSAVK